MEVDFLLGHHLLETCVFLFQLLESFRLVGAQPAVFLAPAIIRLLDHLNGAGGIGPILSLGVRLRIREELAIDGMVEYSTHQYQRKLSENPTVSDPDNSILDVNLLGRLGGEISDDLRFELLGGIGIYSQHNDEYIRNADDILPAEEYTGFGGAAGIGMEMIVSKRVNLAMEGMWRVRRHTTLTLQLGIVFRMGDRSGE